MCLAQGHNTVMLVRLKPAAPRPRVKHCTTEPLCSLQSKITDEKADSICREWREQRYG